ncbi:hypothetical protein [Nonlabens agnitus]|uniref:Uncharacterized protein n=1 Tax=Nonlabens agnitus TaxID=870484 RepID=A0A2S9WQA7_9FLAO|nr:hypothetical protein [Nonlabens agnitus]PRP65660.1 hypothetical protein BST86_00425 [Nonlabens agnitus]
MNSASQLLVTTCSIAGAILVISIIASQVLFKNRTHQNNALAIPSLVLAMFALLMGWYWFYYVNLFFTLPFCGLGSAQLDVVET